MKNKPFVIPINGINIRQTENFNVGQKKRFCTKKRCINDLPRKGVKYLTIIINA